MANINWRTINIDIYDPESPANFSTASLQPAVIPVTASEVQALASQVRQLLRSGDSEGALRGALENAPYGGDEATKARTCLLHEGTRRTLPIDWKKLTCTSGQDVHLATLVEILQSTKQSEMTPMLNRIYNSEGGVEALDVLMKYLYKGMAHSSQTSVASSRTLSPQPTGFSQMHSRVGAGEGSGQAMSVLLSWHEKLVEIVGPGSIVRVLSDRRTV